MLHGNHPGGNDQAPLMGQGGHEQYPPTNPNMGYNNQQGGYPPQGGQGYPPTQPQLGGGPPGQQPAGGAYGYAPVQGGGYASPQYANHPNKDFFGNFQFAASCSVVLGAIIGAVVLLLSFELMDCLEMLCFGLFGCGLAVVDNPFLRQNQQLARAKAGVHKYIHLVTRITGKGVCFVFLGCALFSAMWTNIESGFLKFIAFALNFYILAVGVLCIAMGYYASSKLHRVRDHIMKGNPSDFNLQTYTPRDFKEITQRNCEIKFNENDLKYIFNALAMMPQWRKELAGPPSDPQRDQMEPRLSDQDITEWKNYSGFVFV